MLIILTLSFYHLFKLFSYIYVIIQWSIHYLHNLLQSSYFHDFINFSDKKGTNIPFFASLQNDFINLNSYLNFEFKRLSLLPRRKGIFIFSRFLRFLQKKIKNEGKYARRQSRCHFVSSYTEIYFWIFGLFYSSIDL